MNVPKKYAFGAQSCVVVSFYFLHPKLRKIDAVLITLKLIALTLRRLRHAVSAPSGCSSVMLLHFLLHWLPSGSSLPPLPKGCTEGRKGPPDRSRSLPLTPSQMPPSSTASVIGSNRPHPLRQPAPTP